MRNVWHRFCGHGCLSLCLISTQKPLSSSTTRYANFTLPRLHKFVLMFFHRFFSTKAVYFPLSGLWYFMMEKNASTLCNILFNNLLLRSILLAFNDGKKWKNLFTKEVQKSKNKLEMKKEESKASWKSPSESFAIKS